MLPGKRVTVNGGSCRQNPEAAQSSGIVRAPSARRAGRQRHCGKSLWRFAAWLAFIRVVLVRVPHEDLGPANLEVLSFFNAFPIPRGPRAFPQWDDGSGFSTGCAVR